MTSKNFNVALLNCGEFGRELGKRSTSTDLTIYSHRQGDDIFCFFDPHQYPNRIRSLMDVLATPGSLEISGGTEGIAVDVRFSKYYTGAVEAGRTLYLAVGMQHQ